MTQSIEWLGDRLRFIDQSLLPLEERYNETDDCNVVAEAIRSLKIRGAPLIGIAAAYALALAAAGRAEKDPRAFHAFLLKTAEFLASTRPTAVNLQWALQRLLGRISPETPADEAKRILAEEAIAIHREDSAMCRRIGENGAALLENNSTVITHCNTGALATGGEGTALAVITTAHRTGKSIKVYADETRPLFQGSRLTAWELMKAGIDVTVITDSTAAALMKNERITCVITGADRIASNGDAANKIGTYALAVAARYHEIPMYIAAPSSTIDASIKDGNGIPIEERSPEEVTSIHGYRTAPTGARVYAPAFDVTPAQLITAIVTEKGIYRGPYAFTEEKVRERVELR
jgi:methylthioribose-1-phosphate isomerase